MSLLNFGTCLSFVMCGGEGGKFAFKSTRRGYSCNTGDFEVAHLHNTVGPRVLIHVDFLHSLVNFGEADSALT